MKIKAIPNKLYLYNKLKAMEQAEPADYLFETILYETLETGGVITWPRRLKESGRVFRWISKQIDEKYHSASWAIISAWHPKEKKTLDENKKATREFVHTLWSEGYSAIPLKGVLKDKNEIKDWEIFFFVPGIVKGIKSIHYMLKYTEFKKFIEELATKYNQEWYIIYNPENDIIELWRKETTGKYHLNVEWNRDSFNPDEFINIYKTRFKELVDPQSSVIQQNPQQPKLRIRIYEGYLKRTFTWMQAIAHIPKSIVYYEILIPFFNDL